MLYCDLIISEKWLDLDQSEGHLRWNTKTYWTKNDICPTCRGDVGMNAIRWCYRRQCNLGDINWHASSALGYFLPTWKEEHLNFMGDSYFLCTTSAHRSAVSVASIYKNRNTSILLLGNEFRVQLVPGLMQSHLTRLQQIWQTRYNNLTNIGE